MTALGNKGCLCGDTGSLQQFIELLALTAGYYVIFFAMEDDNGRILRVDIIGGTETPVFVGLLVEF